MKKICLFLFFICALSFALFAAEPAREIEISSNISNKHIPQGSTYPVRISIKNISENIIIPLGFWAEYAGGEDIEGSQQLWSKPLYGMITFSETEDAYHLNPAMQIESFARLHTKIIFPGETTVFEKEMRFLKTGRTTVNLGLLYLKGSPEGTSRAVYISPNTPKPSDIIYRHPTPAEFSAWQERKIPSEPSFILHEPAPLKSETASSSAAIEIEPLGMGLEDAFKKAGITTSLYTFSFWKNGWALEKDNTLYIVDVQGMKIYPHLSLDIFKFIESSDPAVYFITYDTKAFEKIRHMFLGYDIKEERMITIKVPRDAALDVCKYLNNVKFEASLSEFGLTPAIEIKEIKK